MIKKILTVFNRKIKLTKMSLKTLLVVFGFLGLLQRLFYFQLDNFFGVKTLDILFIVLIVLAIILLILTIIKAAKKQFKPLCIFIFIITTLHFKPFEYIIGWTQFKFNNNDREKITANLKNGIYNDIPIKQPYPQYGIWIEDHNPRFQIFKDSTLQMVFLWQGHIRTHEEYCGVLYISDIKQIDSNVVNDFLGREFHKKYLGDNWYYVDCYINRTPFPSTSSLR